MQKNIITLILAATLIICSTGIANAGWISGKVTSVIVKANGSVDLVLTKADNTAIWRPLKSTDIDRSLAIALTAQANSSNISMFHDSVEGVKSWTSIRINN